MAHRHHAGAAEQQEQGRAAGGVADRQAVIAVEIGGQPGRQRAGDVELEAAADIGAEQRSVRRTAASATGASCPTRVAGRSPSAAREPGPCGAGGRAADRARPWRARRGDDDEGGRASHRCAAIAAAEPDAEHLAEQPAGHEGGGQRRAQALGKDADDDGDADAAIGRLADADERRGRRTSPDRSAAMPQSRVAMLHITAISGEAADPPQRSASSDSGKVSRPTMSATTPLRAPSWRVAERPFRLEQREDGVQHLPRHIVGNEQAEGQREDQPGIGRPAGPSWRPGRSCFLRG